MEVLNEILLLVASTINGILPWKKNLNAFKHLAIRYHNKILFCTLSLVNCELTCIMWRYTTNFKSTFVWQPLLAGSNTMTHSHGPA